MPKLFRVMKSNFQNRKLKLEWLILSLIKGCSPSKPLTLAPSKLNRVKSKHHHKQLASYMSYSMFMKPNAMQGLWCKTEIKILKKNRTILCVLIKINDHDSKAKPLFTACHSHEIISLDFTDYIGSILYYIHYGSIFLPSV